MSLPGSAIEQLKEERARAGHDPACDLDPVTLTFKREIPAGQVASVCFECAARIATMRDRLARLEVDPK